MAMIINRGATLLRSARRSAGVVVAACALTVVAGCASLGQPDATPGAPATTPDLLPSDRTGWSPVQADVTTVRPGDAPATVVLSTEVGVAPECAGDPQVTYVTVEGGRVFANVTAPVSPDTQVYGGPCANGSAAGEVVLELGSAPDGAVLVLNQDPWEPDGAGGYQRCDPYLGCGSPPENPCDGYLARFVAGLDVPQHTHQGVEACDGTWMVYAVDPAASFCGPTDGASTCDVPSQLRYAILRFDPAVPAWTAQDWVSPQHTCADVRESLPDLPAAMCIDVPVP